MQAMSYMYSGIDTAKDIEQAIGTGHPVPEQAMPIQ